MMRRLNRENSTVPSDWDVEGDGHGSWPGMETIEYEVWREFIQERCGLYFSESQIRYLSQRLQERMRFLRIGSFSEYYNYVAYNAESEGEWEELLELLLNKETGFFRHMPSFNALTEHLLPQLLHSSGKEGLKPIRLWSVGCSTGQEAYSLAMAFIETVLEDPLGKVWTDRAEKFMDENGIESQQMRQVKVTGSDISRNCLDRAGQGKYKPHEVRFMPEQYREKYLSVIKGTHNVFYQVVDRVRALVKFGYLNLHDLDHCWISSQDVVFCQNVLIYFQAERREEIIQQLCQRLNPGGYLILAPAEVIGLKHPSLRRIHLPESLIYQRVQ